MILAKSMHVHILFSGPWIDLIAKGAGVLSMLNAIFTTCHVTGHKKTIFPTKLLEKKKKF